MERSTELLQAEAAEGDARAIAGAAASWRPGEPCAAAQHAARSVLLRGVLQALGGAAVGVVVFFVWWRPLAYVAFALSALVLLAVLVAPRRGYPLIASAFQGIGTCVGLVLTVTLLGVVFVGFFVPFGLLWRRGRRDRLQRRFRAPTPTYWRDHVTDNDPASYERQV